jgi:hypothetical protein
MPISAFDRDMLPSPLAYSLFPANVIHTKHTVRLRRQTKDPNEARAAHTRGYVFASHSTGPPYLDAPKQLRGMHNPIYFWRPGFWGPR